MTPSQMPLRTASMDVSSGTSMWSPLHQQEVLTPTQSPIMLDEPAVDGPPTPCPTTTLGMERHSPCTKSKGAVNHQHPRASFDLTSTSKPKLPLDKSRLGPEPVGQPRPEFSITLQPRMLRGTVELQKNGSAGFMEYGTGAWSVVYQAFYRPEPRPLAVGSTLGLPSPPESPVVPSSCLHGAAPQAVAVKAPLRSHLEDALSVVRKEARILTYIQPLALDDPTRPRHEHVVTFLGFEPSISALVLEAVPLTLHEWCHTRARMAQENFSTRTMHDPVVGTEQWLQLARQLIAGLQHLRRLNVVHGDIKPANILLRGRGPSSSHRDDLDDTVAGFDPVYCDFSSAHVVQDGVAPELVTAVTTTYTAPELLKAFYRRTGVSTAASRPIATYDSDVFALGVTLLMPAVGGDVYGEVNSSMQKLVMAQEGQPLEVARRGSQAGRVIRGRLVDRIVRDAVARDPDARVKVDAWKGLVDGEMASWKEGK